MWLRKRMQAYNTKRAKEQLSIHRHQHWQSNASYQQHEYWKSRRMALSYNTDYRGFPSQMHKYREMTNPRCSCDTCSLIKAQEMDRYYTAHGQSPLYLTSWPMAMQPQSYKQGFNPAQGSNIQPQYQEISQPFHPRGVPLMFTQPAHPVPQEPQQNLHFHGYPESRTYPPTSEIHSTPVNLSTQPQGPTLNTIPTTPQQIPHPAGHPESRSIQCPPSEIQDSSPPSAFKASPTLTTNGSVSKTPLRPGGVAYDHHDLPKIVAVHSLPSSPVYVREQLIAATLLPMGSMPAVHANESHDGNGTDSHLRPPHKVCLENRYPTIEPKTTDTLAEAKKTSEPPGKIAEHINIVDDNFKDQSNTFLVKCEPVSPVSQLPESPKHYILPQHHSEALTDTSVGQEEAAQSKDVIDREMKIRTLLRRINEWQIDFNQETEDIKKWKMLNLILEARAELEKLRLNRECTNIPNPGKILTASEKDKSEAKEMTAGPVSNNEDTTAVEATGTVITMETNSDMTARTAIDYESKSEYVETRITPKNIMETKSDEVTAPKITMETKADRAEPPKVTMETESNVKMLSPEITMETKSDEATISKIAIETKTDRAEPPKVTMETESNVKMLSPEITMESKSDEATTPKFAIETKSGAASITTMETKADNMSMSLPEITMETEIDGEKTSSVTMETNINNTAQESDAVRANIISSQFFVESTLSSVMGTNTDVSNANAGTLLTSTNVTMTTSNNNMTTEVGTMATVHNDSSYNDSRNSSPSPDNFASTHFFTSSEKDTSVTMGNPCQTAPIILDKNTLLQPHIVVNLFDRVKLFDRRKKLVGRLDDTVSKEAEAQKNFEKVVMTCEKNDSGKADISNASENRILDQIHDEPVSSTNNERSQRLSPALPNIIKDPFATTEIRRKKQAGYSKASESDSDDVWTMELDENSHKAVFRRRWKRTGGPFDRKRFAYECQTTGGNEENELIQGEEWFFKSTESSPPSKKRALLELRIIENEDENDDDDDERIINEAIKISPIFKNLASGQLKRSIHSRQEPTSSIYPTDKFEPYQDLLPSDLEMAEGGVEEMASSEDDVEESIFILENSLQLRESKIQRLNEKKEQLLDELKRIKASSPNSVPRDL